MNEIFEKILEYIVIFEKNIWSEISYIYIYINLFIIIIMTDIFISIKFSSQSIEKRKKENSAQTNCTKYINNNLKIHVVYLFARILICIRYTFFPRFHLGGVSNWETFQLTGEKTTVADNEIYCSNFQSTIYAHRIVPSPSRFKRAAIFHSAVVIFFA